LSEIRQQIAHKLGSISAKPPHAIIAERHRQILISVNTELGAAETMLQSLEDDVVVLCTARIRAAIELLGTITGKTYYDELLTSIFSKFCIGK